jgi:hypothetical protein
MTRVLNLDIFRIPHHLEEGLKIYIPNGIFDRLPTPPFLYLSLLSMYIDSDWFSHVTSLHTAAAVASPNMFEM